MTPTFYDFFKSFYYINTYLPPVDLSDEALSKHLIGKENPNVARIAQRLISHPDVQRALSEPLPYDLTEREERNAILRKHGFRLLGSGPKVVEHDALPGWIIKSGAEALPKDRFIRGPHNDKKETCFPTKEDGLLRIEMALRIAKIAKEENIEIIVPKKKLIAYANADNVTDPTRKYCILSEKLNVLSQDETYDAIENMDSEHQRDIAKKLSTLVQKTGWADPAIRNLRLTTEGKIALFDTEPMGLMVSKKPGFFNYILNPSKVSVEKCARVGLFNLLESTTDTTEELPILGSPSLPGLEEFHKQIKSDYEQISPPKLSHWKITCSVFSLGLYPLVIAISAFFKAEFAKKIQEEADALTKQHSTKVQAYQAQQKRALERQDFVKQYKQQFLHKMAPFYNCIEGVPFRAGA